ncbi:hypothetical protein B0H14DRAFT_2812062, partial [Mycena olivaceomarginata]
HPPIRQFARQLFTLFTRIHPAHSFTAFTQLNPKIHPFHPDLSPMTHSSALKICHPLHLPPGSLSTRMNDITPVAGQNCHR